MKTASWYHASLKPISRSAGRSAVACAAYRTGARMEDVRYGAVRDFSRKGDVVTAFTFAREGAPAWAFDTEELWNAVEAKENRKNSQLAFEWEVALPNELDAGQREAIARRFSGWLVEEYGVAVTTGIHEGGNRGNGLNDHMHVMMTTRAVDEDGWAKHKLRAFSTQPGKPNPEVDRVRGQIADFINDALEEAGSDGRVDPRSYAARGIAQEPTTHLGPAATAMERFHRDRSDRGDINRAIIEERLRWQMEQAAPEITAEVERDLAARFESWQPLERGAAASASSLAPTAAEAPAIERPEAAPELARAAAADTSELHRGWRLFVDRVRAVQVRAVEIWHDEASASGEAERGFAQRLRDAGHRLADAWRHPEQVLHPAPAAASPAETPGEGSGPKGWTERAQEAGRDFLASERGAVPADSFDRMVEAWRRDAAPPLTSWEPPDLARSPDPEPEPPDIGGPDMA